MKFKTYHECDCGDYEEGCIRCFEKDVLKLIKTIRPKIPIGMLITDKVQLERGIELLRCELRDKIQGD